MRSPPESGRDVLWWVERGVRAALSGPPGQIKPPAPPGAPAVCVRKDFIVLEAQMKTLTCVILALAFAPACRPAVAAASPGPGARGPLAPRPAGGHPVPRLRQHGAPAGQDQWSGP